MLMKVRETVDFHRVEEGHLAIDARLQNWARWCNGSSVSNTSPMFRLVPPPPRVRGDIGFWAGAPVDKLDAAKMAKAVAALPAAHRASINWHYIKPVSPRKACQAIGCSMEGLGQLVRDARQMLINRLPKD